MCLVRTVDGIGEVRLSGPPAHLPTLYTGFEDYHHPRLARLRDRYKIDEAVDGVVGEFDRFLSLRNWVHSQWVLDQSQTVSGDALEILEQASRGVRFCCGHSMVVLQAVMASFGYVVRNLGIERDHRVGEGFHHGVNEVWSNHYAKWVVLDATYDVHYERDGTPLSALELHEAARADGGKGIVKMRGTDRRPYPMEESDALEASVRTYWWTAWHLRMDPFTHPYWAGADRLMVYDNDAFRSGTWLRQQGDRRVSHWAYGADAFVPVSDRHQVEWTPGVPDLTFHVEGPGQVRVDLRSATPNLRDYGIRLNGKGEHSATGRGIRWLLREGTNRLVAHTRNLFGVDGPGVQAVLEAEGGVV